MGGRVLFCPQSWPKAPLDRLQHFMRSSARSSGRSLRLPKADLLAIIGLIAVPVVLFGVAAAIGHPIAPGDDQIQNFPLRVLAGRQLAAGHLPVFDPYIWSGAPLLAGWNAGALYPFTFLFTFLSPDAAWAINEMIVYAVAAVGLYAFLRALPLAPIPSVLGAATFAFAGAMDVHLAHFGLVAGMSWIPFILLAMVKLSRHTTPTARVLWIVVLAAAGGLSVLAGEPRAIDTTVIVSALYFAWIVLRMRSQALPFVGSVAGAAVLAVLIGAVQWLPGAMAVHTSQRANDTYSLFASGSLSPRWLLLILVPGLLGGSGSFGTASWFAGYNLPEVMGYVGIVPVVGAFALLGRLRLRRPLPDWIVWHVMALIGIILAIGSFTPLGHLLAAMPLFGGQRLQSRNIAVTDLALAVLLAYWIDDLLRRKGSEEFHLRKFGVVERSRYLALVPIVVALLLVIAALSGPVALAHRLGVSGGRIAHAVQQRPFFVVSLVLIAVTAVVLIGIGRVKVRGRKAWILVVLVTIDLITFNVSDVWSIAPGLGRTAAAPSNGYATDTAPAPMAATALAGMGTTGRFAMFDPDGVVDMTLRSLSSPDLNVLNGLFSLQGYSSIVYGPYAKATGSHAANGMGNNALSPSAVGSGLLDQLDATTLVTSPSYLVRPASAATAAGTTPVGADSAHGPGARSLVSGGEARWVFGETIAVSTISLPWLPTGAPSSASWRIGLEESDGRTQWPEATVSTSPAGIFVQLARSATGVGLVLESSGGTGLIGPPALTTAHGTNVVLDGELEDQLISRWTFEGDKGTLAVFSNRDPVAPLTLRPVEGRSLGRATVRALSGPTIEPTSAAVDSAHGAVVVRSLAMIPGWSATWTPSAGGPETALPIRASGLVQAVVVPPGRGVVTWRYNAPGLDPGLVLSLVGTLLLIGLLAGTWWRRRARARGRPS
jgi:hypothetical protein